MSPEPDRPTRILTAEEVQAFAVYRRKDVRTLADSHEALRAQVAALTQERDKWFANLNVVMKALRDEEPLTEYERKYANAAVASNLILGQRRFKEQADKAEDTLASLRALLPEIEIRIGGCSSCGGSGKSSLPLTDCIRCRPWRQVRDTLTEKDGVET